MAAPVKFDEANVVFAADQPEYHPLPAHRTPLGKVTTCWELSEEDMAIILRTKRVYVSQLTFNSPLQPLLVSATAEEILD